MFRDLISDIWNLFEGASDCLVSRTGHCKIFQKKRPVDFEFMDIVHSSSIIQAKQVEMRKAAMNWVGMAESMTLGPT